jgi:hypothetical protein
MTHKNRESRDYAPVARSLQEDESHGGSVLSVALEPETWTDSAETLDCVDDTHASHDITTGGVDVDGHGRVLSRDSVELLNETRGGTVVYLTDKPDEVLLAEFDDLERLDAYLPEGYYWGEE